MSQKLRGLVAQGMNGRKHLNLPSLVAFKDSLNSDTSYIATTSCVALIYAWGGAGSGAMRSTAVASGAGAGAAGFKRVRLSAGQTLSWSAGVGGADVDTDNTDGNDGTDTTVTLPTGIVLTAGGGKKGVQGTSPQTGGLGGACSPGWDLARSGGNGGDGVTSASTAGGSPSPSGGTGGGGSGNYGGGGAAPDFRDQASGATAGGNGASGNASTDHSTAPGGASAGGGSTQATFAGKDGRVIVYVVHVAA